MAKLSLVDARGLLGWSRTRLCEEASLRPSTLSEIETGHNNNPGYQTVMRIIVALQRGGLQGLKPEDIFAVTEPESVER